MSTEQPRLDPRQTFAVIVAVETYTHGKITPLDGPAQDALGHAQWLLDSGVPARNIRLCVSAMPHNDADVRARALAMGVPVLPATHDMVWEIIDKELPERHDDLLWFAWSGHGALDPRTDEHRLFFADAAPDREYALNLDNLQKAFLHSPRFQNIRHKALFVDACRHFQASVGGYGGRSLSLPAGEGARSPLLTMYAVQDGAFASSEPEGGNFTRALLNELDSASKTATSWPPDLTRLIEPVRERTAELADRQTPRIDARDWNGTPYRWDAPTPRAPGLLDHREAIRKLGPKGTYLSGDTLPYVAPDDPDDRACPENLLARLADPPTTSGYGGPLRGVLLTAPAGAGKTRTCLEVARLAHENKWQVLHLEQDAGLSAYDLLAEVQEEIKARPDRPLLLIFDYLDQHHRLDLKALGRALYAEDQAGGRIACLASVRPGALRDVRKSGSQDLFEEIGLSQDESYRKAVAAQIFATAAPRALEAWGYSKMTEICGERPIFALLHALAVEQLVGTDGPPAAPPRPRDLVNWLDRRTPEGIGSQTDGPPARTALLAATVAALSCAQEREAVEAAVDRFLDAHALGHDDDGESTVNHLEALGWLVPTKADGPDTMDTVHDIVTDAFLQQTCLKDASTFHSATLRKLLSALLGDLRSFRRATGHLNRWAADLDDQKQGRIAAACSRWLGEHAEAFVDMLLSSPEHGMRLLVAMVSTTPWRQGITENWDAVVARWTRDVAERSLTRLFLANAIRNCDDQPPAPLTAAALTWLDGNADTDLDAVHLINTLARSVADEDRDRLEARTSAWLRRYGAAPEARNRLELLLQCHDHRGATADEITRTALALAERCSRDLGTERLLIPLLRSDHMAENDWRRISTATQQWLKEQQTRERAAFVLSAALRQDKLPASAAEYIAKLALGWLGLHGRKTVAGFVLTQVLERCDIPDKLLQRAIERAHSWLTIHGTRTRASHVIARLLSHNWTGTPHSDPRTAVTRALTWLETHADTRAADFVLRLLLRLPDATTDDLDAATVADQSGEHALTWLEKYGATSDDTQTLTYLLALLTRDRELQERTARALELQEQTARALELQERTARAVTVALLRLERPGPPQQMECHPLRELLKIKELPEHQQERVLALATTWLRHHNDIAEAPFVLTGLIGQARFRGAQDVLALAVERALAWLDKYGDHDRVGSVLWALLKCQDIATETLDAATVADRTFELTLAWLAEEAPQDPRRLEQDLSLLRILLARGPEFTPDQAECAALRTVARLRGQHRNNRTGDRNPVLELLLKLPPLHPETERGAIRCAKKWLGHRPADLTEDDSFILSRLLQRLETVESPDAAAIRLALGWLKNHGTAESASFVLRRLLEIEALPLEVRKPALGYAVDWLDEHSPLEVASFVLAPVLFRLQEAGLPDPGTVRQALDWLAEHGQGEHAWRVIRSLGEYAGAAPHHTAIRDYAEAWITAHPDATAEHAHLERCLEAPATTPVTSCTSTAPAPGPR
ncbi:hypothetical protein [Streptomyces sp. NPDC001530]|uniref:hypothetical protein n=1 Tax=Streptomyces sp. NPDC001530 TaxID=3364582 RepID=UPI00368FCC90